MGGKVVCFPDGNDASACQHEPSVHLKLSELVVALIDTYYTIGAPCGAQDVTPWMERWATWIYENHPRRPPSSKGVAVEVVREVEDEGLSDGGFERRGRAR